MTVLGRRRFIAPTLFLGFKDNFGVNYLDFASNSNTTVL